MNKIELRKLYLDKIASLGKKEKQDASEKACEFLLQQLKNSFWIGSYFPLSSEVDLSSLNQVLAEQKRLALPRVEGDEIAFYSATHISENLKKSALNIYEPLPHQSKRLTPQDLSCLIVPGLAYDTDNYRLGRGRGFYDRFLSQPHSFHTLAVAFGVQKHLGPLPLEEHDQPLDEVYYF